ncbi:MAG: hypothetical protein AAFQ43_05435 [Bacteroidota bacterium]
MRRSTLFSLGLAGLIALAGSAPAEAQRPSSPHYGAYDYRPGDYQYSNRYGARGSREWRRVERDVRRYVRSLDRELRLTERQAWRIGDILERRAYKLLSESRTRNTSRIYPFPRRFRSDRYANRTIAYFWRDADRRIERVLQGRQLREYRYLTGRTRHRGNRGRYDDGRRGQYHYDGRYDDRYDDDRYDDRYRGRDRD